MAALRLLGNVNISPKTVAVLRQHGWDIVRVSDLLPVHAPDTDIRSWHAAKTASS